MELKGITWDHERGYNPLIPVSEQFSKTHPGVSITWAKRSLKDFGDFPVSRLVETYDLIMIDHPFMAEALKEKLLLVLNEYLEPGILETLKKESIGKSFDSYCVEGLYQALPVDAATQISAANMRRLDEKHVAVPRTFAEVLSMKERLGNYSIGTAMAATDIFSIYLGLVAQQLGRSYFSVEKGVDQAAGERAAELLYRLVSVSDPESFEMNPIQLLDAMSTEGRIVYTPYVYGYTNYSRQGFRKHILEFRDAPLIDENAEVSTQMGGVGISVSAKVAPEKKEMAVKFALYLASCEIQRGIYTKADEQPAALSAWLDADNNRITNGFFEKYHRHATDFVHQAKGCEMEQLPGGGVCRTAQRDKGEKSSQTIASHFNELYRAHCVDK